LNHTCRIRAQRGLKFTAYLVIDLLLALYGRFFVSGGNGQKLSESSHFVLFSAEGNKSVPVFYIG
jgi:hypothetical protein